MSDESNSIEINIDDWADELIAFAYFVRSQINIDSGTARRNLTTGEFAISEKDYVGMLSVGRAAQELIEGFAIGRDAYNQKQESAHSDSGGTQ